MQKPTQSSNVPWINSFKFKIHIHCFIQTLLLNSVFHEGLGFMKVGHNPMCVSILAPCSWGFIWGAVNPPSPLVILPLEALAIWPIADFQIAFPCIIRWPNIFLFQNSFCLRKTCMVTSSPHNHTLNGNTKWQALWTYHNFFSKPHAHAISCRTKRCWSQIN